MSLAECQMMVTPKIVFKCRSQPSSYDWEVNWEVSWLTGQIGENSDRNYRFSNIESTATCKHQMQEMRRYYCRERDSRR